MKLKLLFPVVLLLYALVVLPVSKHLQDRPIAIKLGFMPSAEVLAPLSLDHDLFVSNLSVFKVLFYYGTLVEQWINRVEAPVEYFNMFKTLETAIKLDPYNLDAYYLAQASFTWEINRAADVNRFLEYGMKFRTWDAELPFYAGFNYAYFLQDYVRAAEMMKIAADLSGETYYTTLAARYFYESGQTDLGINFLEVMKRRAVKDSQREWYEVRQEALLAIRHIQQAVDEYAALYGAPPQRVEDLVSKGILSELPSDPYGGTFFIDEYGTIRTTSHMTFAALQKVENESNDGLNKK